MRRGRRPACGCAPRGCGSAARSRRDLQEAEGELRGCPELEAHADDLHPFSPCSLSSTRLTYTQAHTARRSHGLSERICRAVRYFLGVAHRTRPPGARLYQPGLDAAARDAAIDDLIKSVGLEDQRQVKAGNDFTWLGLGLGLGLGSRAVRRQQAAAVDRGGARQAAVGALLGQP
eukprot:scaffold40369_cov51-Phaeocystis_antarctica.AAC.4